MSDAVNHPSHYAGSIECKDAMRSAMETATLSALHLTFMVFYWWGCAFKYLWRWPAKNGIEDLKKCRQCLDFLIEELENGN